MKNLYSKLSLSIIVIVIASLLSPLFVASAYNKTSAESYLLSHSNNPWSVMALVALGQNPNVDFLKIFSANTAVDYSAPILALTAAGKDPKTFPADNLIAKLKSFHQQNQIGDPATVNDDIFGLLALISAGEPLNDVAIVDAKNFILQNQKPNGGWGFAVSAGTDSNITAAAIVALKAAGLTVADEKIAEALDYLKTAQNNDGGFTYDPQSQWGTASDSSSTAWVMWALNALNINESTWSKNGHTPSDYLSSTQTQTGYFEWQAGAGENSFSAANTAYAVIALEGKTPYQLSANADSGTGRGSAFSFRIEGSNETVCEGKTEGPTALEIVKNGSLLCGFTYHIKDTSFGPYLDKINADSAGGTTGWLYWVNFNSPSIGAADYQLQKNDEVLWAFGNFDIQPTRLTLTPTETSSGQPSQAAVEYFDASAKKPLADAKVLLGASEFATDVNGKAQITGADGFYKVFAQKPGFVRTNKILLKIGAPASASVNLSVNVKAGQVAGETQPPALAFSVEPSSLDFGDLKPGLNATKNLKIKNTGAQNLEFQSQVAEGDLFKANLKLDEKIWREFKKAVSAGAETEVKADLTIPPSAPLGPQTGALIFWAAPR